jgi:putative CocE/NonD family hydrolase
MTAPDLPFGLPLPERPPRAVFEELVADAANGPRTLEVGIPMRDGLELAADVYLPPDELLPAPAIVTGTPYDKSGGADLAYRDAGYAVVVYDCRGRGKSEGEFRAFDVDERQDAHDVVEWVATQEWCDSNVGVSGLSYGGWLVWAAISERPPHLRAAISQSAAGRWQQEIPYTFGCFQLYNAMWFSVVRRRIADRTPTFKVSELVETLPVSAIGDALQLTSRTWRDFLEHDALDELWRSRRWDGGYDFDVPCLHVTGWHDREDIHGAFHHYEQMVSTSPARGAQWLLVGPWSHISTRWPSEEYAGVASPDGGVDMTEIHVRFFDRFLKDERNGVDDEPRVRLYDTGRGAWGVREAWQGSTSEQRFFLAADSALSSSAPRGGGEESFRYDPLAAPGVRFDTDARWEPPLELGDLESQDGVVTWTSAPLDDDLTVHGWSHLDLYAASDCEDTEWHVKLADADEGGRSLCVAWGCLRASHAADPSAPQPVVPGAAEHYEIELSPAFHTFRRGHRVRLVLAGSDYPWFARNMNRFGSIADQDDPRVATNTVYYDDARPSALRLSVETRCEPYAV